MLAGMDAAAVVAAMAFDAEDPLYGGEFTAGFYRRIPKTWVAIGNAQSSPKEIEDRTDCARKVLAGLDAEIMVALKREEEAPKGERLISALWDCVFLPLTRTETSRTTTQTRYITPRGYRWGTP